MDLRTLGVFAFLDGLSGGQTGQFARQVERLGYSALWFAETSGRESFSFASYLLSQTERLVVATGIAVVFSYEPIATANAARTLGELFEDRFILGLGVSNKKGNARRGVAYEKPYSFMREYLTKMRAAPYGAPKPQHEPPIVLAGMMPKMLQLAASETRGTHTYFTTTDQIAQVRAALGPDPWLCAELGVMLETDAAKARAAARRYMQVYLSIDHYVNRLRAVGFTDADFADGGSDRLVAALIAWGNEDKLRERIEAYYRAGATHVCIMPLSSAGGLVPDERALEALTPR
ncbi:MAG TPA: TIGR03620 family F420-dependent LLM class oxidoreductase [Candidatus Binatia bacterium]|jgi:probable F420-dependent oxidoreductase|nr:TIGR03620 family F420-dependent LLM class oxidoreductase [Candidatus Binatia bacterium]